MFYARKRRPCTPSPRGYPTDPGGSRLLADVGPISVPIATRPWESDIERAHRLCGACGLPTNEINQLIDDVRHSTLAREENLELFYATFKDRADAKLCEPCAEAALDAAEEQDDC